MLTPNNIPSKEPLLRVGIVLPEDGQDHIFVKSEGSVLCSMDGKTHLLQPLSIKIEVQNNRLTLSSEEFNQTSKTINLELQHPGNHFLINPVRTGRAFHWEKKIPLKLTHKIEVKTLEGVLLLINELPLENYLACVATSEMSAACPENYIAAQTIVARSWMLANVEQKHVHLGFDVCNDDCCQRFQGITHLTELTIRMTQRTKGQVLMYQDKICDARYSKSCGGVMESFENLWEDTPLPYMQNKVDAENLILPKLTDEARVAEWVKSVPESFCSPHFIAETELPKYLGKVDEAGKYFRWVKLVSQKDLLKNINTKLGLGAKSIVDLIPLKRAGSGRMLELKIEYIDSEGNESHTIVHKDYEARNILHPDFLYSSACIIEKITIPGESPDFKYSGAGWGHGAGLCQIGALGMALNGYKTEEILCHYYPGSRLEKIYK